MIIFHHSNFSMIFKITLWAIYSYTIMAVFLILSMKYSAVEDLIEKNHSFCDVVNCLIYLQRIQSKLHLIKAQFSIDSHINHKFILSI